MDMSKMLKDLQKMQSKMLKAQNDLKAQSLMPKLAAEW